MSLLAKKVLWQELDNIKQEMTDSLDSEEHETASMQFRLAVGSTFALTAGAVSWMARGSSFLASLLSSMPIWYQIDPLAVLLTGRKATKKSRLSMFGRRKTARTADKPCEPEEIETIFNDRDSEAG